MSGTGIRIPRAWSPRNSLQVPYRRSTAALIFKELGIRRISSALNLSPRTSSPLKHDTEWRTQFVTSGVSSIMCGVTSEPLFPFGRRRRITGFPSAETGLGRSSRIAKHCRPGEMSGH
jgi:hypothetical protein